MANSDLFHGFPVRFSMKKEQHVKLLEKFEDNQLNDGKAKNQIIMDALEMYYTALEEKRDSDEVVTVGNLEKRLVRFKQDFREEILHEMFRIFVGNNVTRQPAVSFIPDEEPETETGTEEDGVTDISEMPDIMSKIMSWSDS